MTQTKRGGARPGSGPKPQPAGTTKRRHSDMLTPQLAEVLRQIGDGNLSAGIAIAVQQAKKSPPSAG